MLDEHEDAIGSVFYKFVTFEQVGKSGHMHARLSGTHVARGHTHTHARTHALMANGYFVLRLQIAREVCVSVIEACPGDTFQAHLQPVLTARGRYPFITGGVYPDTPLTRAPDEMSPEEEDDERHTEL